MVRLNLENCRYVSLNVVVRGKLSLPLTAHKRTAVYGGKRTNDTVLRAAVLSNDNTYMVFANEEHEEFYYKKLEQARYQDCDHEALIYFLGISEDKRNHYDQIYDIQSGDIQTECLHLSFYVLGQLVDIIATKIMTLIRTEQKLKRE